MGYWKYLKEELQGINYRRFIFNMEILLYVVVMFLIGAVPILFLTIYIHMAFLVLVVPFSLIFGYFINYLIHEYY